MTLDAIGVLRHEGFRVAIDNITPNIGTFIDLHRIPVDRIKVNVSKEHVSQFIDPSIRKGLEKVPAERLIFFHCDNERALAIGREMGVSIFQGWLIDDMAAKDAPKQKT
jgi:EAL domain-containing protein (putative c-di-GMP-specific phosphodiesterase class I)